MCEAFLTPSIAFLMGVISCCSLATNMVEFLFPRLRKLQLICPNGMTHLHLSVDQCFAIVLWTATGVVLVANACCRLACECW